MPELNFTPEQRAAIDTRGSTVLVSAAAGSGKTRVLTERLMAYLTDAENPADIDRFLVITYTRAAAAELRSRILDGIYARIASDPENRRLRRQVLRLMDLHDELEDGHNRFHFQAGLQMGLELGRLRVLEDEA